MVTMCAFKPGFVEVPGCGPQAQNHVRDLLKIHILGPLPHFELSAFGVKTRKLHPIHKKNGETTLLISLVPRPGDGTRQNNFQSRQS